MVKMKSGCGVGSCTGGGTRSHDDKYKTFAGDLEGTSKGEDALTGGAESTGVMAYVALERVTATLSGQSGTFLLMHTASMLKSDPGSGVLQVTVVPHSGTEELAGLAGTMRITIEDGPSITTILNINGNEGGLHSS